MNSISISKYFNKFISCIPPGLETFDTSRVIILQFSLAGLDIINKLSILTPELKRDMIDWIYNLQIWNSDGYNGFRGGLFPQEVVSVNESYMSCHVTMTYSSLCCLLILGDDLSRIDKSGIQRSFKKLQSSKDGCFAAALDCPESDVRFIFSAVASCYILNDFSGIDIDAIVAFILHCQNYDGGFGQRPELESHGGSTYCSLATLKLLGRLESLFPDNCEKKDLLLRWLVSCQKQGFHGRPNKADDSCYTFWIGASLKMLNYSHLVDIVSLMEFIETTYDTNLGGFCKFKATRHCFADPMHTYLCLAGLSTLLSDYQDHTTQASHTLSMTASQLITELRVLEPAINIDSKKVEHLTPSNNDKDGIVHKLVNLTL